MKLEIEEQFLMEALERAFTTGKNTLANAAPSIHARNIVQSLLGRNQLKVVKVS